MVDAKKGQMEIMGLMIVVILLIVGVLFAVKFIVLKEPSDTRQVFTRTQLASNLAQSLLETNTVDCRGTAIKDLMMDCASWPGGTITCNDPLHSSSCDYVNRTLAYIFNATLVQWQTKYEVSAWTDPSSDLFYFSNRGCTDNQPGESESFFLPTDAGLLTLKIFICE